MPEFVLRKGSKSLKYDALEQRFGRVDLLPLWVADMDCRSPAGVMEAIAQRLEHGVCGYSSPEQAVASKNAVCHWLDLRHGVAGLQPQNCLIFAGVLEAFAVCIEVLCARDEALILNSPAYSGFYDIMAASGRTVLENYLGPDGCMDFALLEQQIRNSPVRPRIFLFCSPHNPVGKVWHEWEILELIRLCQKYQLYLISDEIHFDLVYSGHKHLSILQQDFDRILMISGPGKTFNIPALRCAYLVSRNRRVLQQLQRFCRQFQLGEISLLGQLALEACYTQEASVAWLEDLLPYLEQNRDLLHSYLKREFPELKHGKPAGTYLYWVDCRDFLDGDPAALRKFFMDAGLALSWGDLFHGNGWVRINFACERALLEEALENWKRAYENLC